MAHSFNCLIIPADAPPRRSSLKRQLLFFDSVTLIHPDDRALVNDFELRETYPNGTEIQLSARAPFPRVEEYDDVMSDILAETRDLCSQGKIHVLSRTAALSRVDPGTHWSAYAGAITEPLLLRAAIPDYASGKPPLKLPNGIYSGLGVTVPGYRSRYEVECAPPAKLTDVEDAWNGLAQIRLGRHLKYARLAAATGSVALSLDEPNRQLSLALNQPGPPSTESLANYALARDVVDPIALDKALQSLSWKETLTLRRQILPHIAKLRAIILQEARVANEFIDPSLLSKILKKLKDDHDKAKEEVDRRWKELGIATMLKGSAAVTATELGLCAIPAAPIADVVVKLLGGALAAGAALSSELKALIPARAKVKANPLVFFDVLPSSIAEESLNRTSEP